MRFKYHIDGSSTYHFGVIRGQNLTPDSRTARKPPAPGGLPSPGEGRYGLYKQEPFCRLYSLLPTTLIEKRIIRYSKIVIFQSFLL